MWREIEEICSDLESPKPEAVVAAIQQLEPWRPWTLGGPVSRDALRRLAELPLELLTEDLLSQIIALIDGYPNVRPAFSQEDRMRTLVDLVVRTHNDYAALEVNLRAKGRPELLPAILDQLVQTVPNGRAGQLLGHKALSSYLLNAKTDFRAAVLKALEDPALAEVRDWLQPEIDDWQGS